MLPVLVLSFSILLFRLVPALSQSEWVRMISGFSPWLAFAFTGSLFLPRKWALPASLALVIIPHCAINAAHGYSLWSADLALLIAALLGSAWLGHRLRGRATALSATGTAIALSLAFHFVANSVSFFTVPGYSQTLSGFIQAHTTGIPTFTPTWVFTLKGVLGDAIFTVLFFAIMRPHLSARASAAAPLPIPLHS